MTGTIVTVALAGSSARYSRERHHHMIKKLLSTAAVLGTVLGAVAVAAPSASADTAGCRDWTSPDARGVQLAPCFYIPSSDTSTVYAGIGVITNGRDVDPCAQLVNVATGAWAVNYGCNGWVNSGSSAAWSPWLPARKEVGAGRYVVREGYWAYDGGTLHYYDDAESPVITIA